MTDLAFVAEIANMPANLVNLRKEFHTKKTNYFGEGRLVTLTKDSEVYKYLIAGQPAFSAAITAKDQLLAANGVNAGFKRDFLDAIMASKFALSRSSTSTFSRVELAPFYHGDWDHYFVGQPNALPGSMSPEINIWCF